MPELSLSLSLIIVLVLIVLLFENPFQVGLVREKVKTKKQ